MAAPREVDKTEKITINLGLVDLGQIDLLVAEHGMNPVDAYMLCSVCGDLRISEIVDMPNWVVSFYFPGIVFS